MVKDIINSIIDAEAAAQSEIKAAQTLGKEIIFNAERKSDEINESIAAEIKETVRKIISSAEAAADEAATEIINKGREEADALIEKTSGNKAQAARMIADRIIRKYGNS
ncbi:MAG: hypothetical protein ACOX3U_01430 [Christensenellales bacterium]|jgi:vacuolar-type H+-ATPase subunit H